MSKKAEKKQGVRKETALWGIISLVLGMLSMLLFELIFAAVLVGAAAIVFYKIQKKRRLTKIAVAGFITGIIGIVIPLIRPINYLYSITAIFVLLIALFLIWLGIKKLIKKDKAYGIASLVLGILSILFFKINSAALVFGSGAIAFYILQKKNPAKLALIGLITGITGAYLSLMPLFDYLDIKLFMFVISMLALISFVIKKLIARKKEKKKIKIPKWAKWSLIIIGSAIALLIIIGLVIESFPVKCGSKSCFITAARNCRAATLEITEDVGIIRYESEKSEYPCSMKKTIVKLDESESQGMKGLLEGKYTYCKFDSWKSFDEDWVNSLINGIEKCGDEGGLKEAIGNLIIFVE